MKQQALVRKICGTTVAFGILLLIFLASVVFLNPTSVGNPWFVSKSYLWAIVWVLTFIIFLGLSLVLGRNLIKLFFEYQANRPGSRIKTKLVIILIVFSLFPSLIMSFLAFGLINRNLQQWFSSPSRQMLDSSLKITKSYYQQYETFATSRARLLARSLREQGSTHEQDFEKLLKEYSFEGLSIWDQQTQEVFSRGENMWGPKEAREPVKQVLTGRNYYRVQRQVDVDRGTVGVPLWRNREEIQGVLFAHFVIPESVGFHAVQVEEAYRKYEEMKGEVGELEANYLSILAMTTLAVVFGFVWLGTYIARRLTVPLEALAEGSRELASGNLDYRVNVKAVDELAILVEAFNRMADEVKQSRQKLEKANLKLKATNVRLDERRHYIETVLQNIATGVISIDESGLVHTVNEAALKMLQISREKILNRSLREVTDKELYEQFQKMKKRARFYGTYRKEVTFKRGEQRSYIAATITHNTSGLQENAEYLVVLDDLTELIKAEKFAAWQEVGRRLAHEIKNPLTPIQLSAERVKKRFEKIAKTQVSNQEMSEFGKVLSDSVRIIVGESQMLRSLVQEFSQFARLPICRPKLLHLHTLIEKALSLYDGALQQVEIQRRFDPKVRRARLDPEQMQRVFTNLLDNSLDSLADSEEKGSISIRTYFNPDRDSVRIEFLDNGAGIAAGDYENLFLPYFSTKKKGTGLGLAIVRQIISEHKGFIRAEPNVPRGTKFTIELPIK